MATDKPGSSIRVIDSHAGGEPTRVVVAGAPDIGSGDMQSRREQLKASHDWLRTALVTEPRGSDWMVGAVLQEPTDPQRAAGVVFFNNVGYLGMCGHGMIGVVEALRYLDRLPAGTHTFETPVGAVTVESLKDGRVAVENVLSYRHRTAVEINVPEFGPLTGDVAWGGNWFFIAPSPQPLERANIPRLLELTRAAINELAEQGVTGAGGELIDHVELVGPPSDPAIADAKNFVLCPGGQYDRSPCGTGTSAKLACLAADEKLAPGETWRQESIVGSVFTASYRHVDENNEIIPRIVGRAHINGDLHMVVDPGDPFRFGITAK